MRILTPFLVTLAVTGLAVVLVVRDARAARVRSDAWAWSNATGCVPSGWHPLWSWPGTGHLTVGPRRISVRVVPAEVPPGAAVTPAGACPVVRREVVGGPGPLGRVGAGGDRRRSPVHLRGRVRRGPPVRAVRRDVPGAFPGRVPQGRQRPPGVRRGRPGVLVDGPVCPVR